jgi:hypothetical protein
MESKKLTQELLELILRLNANANAYDEDLASTWYLLKTQWNRVKLNMDSYIAEND